MPVRAAAPMQKVYPDSATWWEENASAQFRGMLGSIFILCGTVVRLVVAFQAMTTGKVASLASCIPGLFITAIGANMFLSYAYGGLKPPFIFGSGLLTLGLNSQLFWSIVLEYLSQYDPDCNYTGLVSWAISASLIFVVLGLIVLTRRTVEESKDPWSGPDNYMMFSVILFGAGVFFALLSANNVIMDSSVTEGRLNSDVFVGIIFVIGAVHLFLHCCRANYNFNGILLQRFPATGLTSASIISSKLALNGALMVFISSVVVIGVMILTRQYVTVVSTGASILSLVGYAAIAFAYRLDSNAFYHCPTLTRGFLLQGIAMLCLAVTRILQHVGSASHTAQYRGFVGAGAFTAAGALLVFRGGLKCYFPPLVNPGNYAFILGAALTFGSSVCYIMHGMAYLEEEEEEGGGGGGGGGEKASPCDVSIPSGTLFVGSVLHLISSLLLVLHAFMAVDVSSITNYTGAEEDDDNLAGLSSDGMIGGGGGDDVRAEYSHGTSNGEGHIESAGVAAWEEKAASDRSVEQIDVDVLVVGGGPVGLAMANELGIRGIQTLVVEKRSDIVLDARFYVVNPATMEGLKRLGLSEKLIEISTPPDFGYGAAMSVGLTHSDMRMIGRCDGPARNDKMALGHNGMAWQYTRSSSSRYAAEQTQRAMQCEQEKVLKDAAEAREGVEVRYGWELLDFRQDDDGVTAIVAPAKESLSDAREAADPTFSGRAGVAVVRSKYIIGCDGPSSTVAEKVGIRYDGFINLSVSRSTQIHAPELLARVTKTHGQQVQYHMAVDGVGVGYIVPSDIRRHLWTFHIIGLMNGVSPKDVPLKEMHGIIQQFIGPDIQFEIRKDSRWYWNFVVARTYRRGRAFICGDAAHCWPPFGAFGGNTGYQDANNLGWKLAASVKGWAGPNLLDSYEVERRSSALRIALHVLRLTPQPDALKMMVKLAPKPAFARLVATKWRYWNSGQHVANHFSSDGMYFGLRYDHSPLCLRGVKAMIVPESPACEWWPVITPGGRAPHLPLEDGSTLFDNLSYDGYSLIVTQLLEGDGAAINSVALLKAAFMHYGLPELKVVNIASTLAKEYSGTHAKVADLYKIQRFIIIRPDFFMLWVGDEVKSSLAGRIAGAAAGKRSMGTVESAQTTSAVAWLTNRWVKESKPFRFRFPEAIFVEDKTKNEILKVVQHMKMKTVGVEVEKAHVAVAAAVDHDEEIKEEPPIM